MNVVEKCYNSMENKGMFYLIAFILSLQVIFSEEQGG